MKTQPKRRSRPHWLFDNRGMVAVEFAIIGPLFIWMVVVVLDFGLMLFTQSVMDGAARDAARVIRTGQITGSGAAAQTAFKTVLCNDIGVLIPCASLVFDAQPFSNFTSINATPAVDSHGNMISNGFNAGASGQPMLVRVTYNRPYMSGIGGLLSIVTHQAGSLPTNQLLISVIVFQNEPY